MKNYNGELGANKLEDIRMAGVEGHIANVENCWEYIFVKGWDVNQDQDTNPGQIDCPDDEDGEESEIYYDAETNEETTI